VARSTPDDIAVARLTGAASYAINRGMTRGQAVAHLHAITARPDLLARAAGITAGARRGRRGPREAVAVDSAGHGQRHAALGDGTGPVP